MTNLPQGALVIRTSVSGQPFYEAKWRDSTKRQCKRRLGPAWLQPGPDGGWTKRRGRIEGGYLNERSAHVAMAEMIAEHEKTIHRHPEADTMTLGALADAWCVYLSRTGGAKPSTIRDYRYMVARPTVQNGAANKARIMRAFEMRRAAGMTTYDIESFLTALDREGLSARNINRHREVLHSVFAFGQERYGLPLNPVSASEKRRQDPPASLDFYSPEEIEALAAAARNRPDLEEFNRGRKVPKRPTELDAQDASLFITAAFTGLRMGELLALRWRDVDFDGSRLTVTAAVSAGELAAPKSNAIRTVPLASQPARELRRLGKRRAFVTRDDFVFCNELGERLDRSAVRRRYKRAQSAAGLRPIRFHDLRHTFGSLAIRKLDSVTVQSMLGHARLSTTERYLHAKPRHGDAATLTEAFGGRPAQASRAASRYRC